MPRPSKFNREMILDSAMELFWTKPYKDIHLKEIEVHTGLKRSNLYEHFENKDDLFRQAFERYRDRCVRRMLDILLNQSSTLEGFRVFFTKLVECLSNPDMIEMHFPDPRIPLMKKNDAQELLVHLRIPAETIQKIFRESLKIGVRRNEFPKSLDKHERAALLFTLYDGIISNSTFEKHSNDLMSMAETAIESLRREQRK